MDLLISNGRKRGDDHVEAIEPRPSLDEVETRHADDSQQHECNGDEFEIAEDFHGAVVGRRSSATTTPRQRSATAYAFGKQVRRKPWVVTPAQQTYGRSRRCKQKTGQSAIVEAGL